MSANSYGDVDANPFEDPAVKNLANEGSANQASLEGYNPFEKSQVKNQMPFQGDPFSPTIQTPQSAPPDLTIHSPPDPPPPYTTSSAQSVSDLQRRQDELERKAAELQAREDQITSRELSTAGVASKNWPPLPKKCCVGPCFYQDISVEIPNGFQRTVRTMYYMWMFYAFMLFLNMLGALALFIASGDGTTFGVSLLVFFLFTPMSFVCWFRPLYKAFRNDSSFNFMVFFFVFFFQFIVAVFYAVGIPHLGSCGLLNGITTLTASGEHTVSTYTVGIIAVFIGFLWAIDAVASFFLLVKIHRVYRSTGASLAKAQEELASGVMRNEQVQNAATSAVTNAVQQAINREASGVRY